MNDGRGLNLKDWRVLREAMAAMRLIAMGHDKEIVCHRACLPLGLHGGVDLVTLFAEK
jgi:hypothetical protein